MHSIKLIVFLGALILIFQSASCLWAGSIYTWTDKNGAVHITETPPPPGAAVEDALSNPPEFPVPVQPSPPPQSVGNWEVEQAEQQAKQAQEQPEAARQQAADAAQTAEARAQEAAGQLQQAEQNAADAQQQVRGAQEDATIFRESE